MTNTIVSATFENSDNIISTLSAGKLKFHLIDTTSISTIHFCLKVTDDSGFGYFTTIDNLSLEVEELYNCDDSIVDSDEQPG